MSWALHPTCGPHDSKKKPKHLQHQGPWLAGPGQYVALGLTKQVRANGQNSREVYFIYSKLHFSMPLKLVHVIFDNILTVNELLQITFHRYN